MIYTDRTITVRKGESKIDEPIVVYRGDYELEVRFTIMNSRFKFMSGTNLIETEKASFGQMAILTPYGGNIFSDIVRCSDGTVTFVLTESMINQIEEIGLYSFQIRLYDYNKESRVSIPPIEFGIEVREPIASEDHDNSVNNAIVGYSIAKVVDPKKENVGDTFDEDGNYNKTKWETGDRISQGKLNKIEDAIDTMDKNSKSESLNTHKIINSNFNLLNTTKADITYVDEAIAKKELEGGGVDTSVLVFKTDFEPVKKSMENMVVHNNAYEKTDEIHSLYSDLTVIEDMTDGVFQYVEFIVDKGNTSACRSYILNHTAAEIDYVTVYLDVELGETCFVGLGTGFNWARMTIAKVEKTGSYVIKLNEADIPDANRSEIRLFVGVQNYDRFKGRFKVETRLKRSNKIYADIADTALISTETNSLSDELYRDVVYRTFNYTRNNAYKIPIGVRIPRLDEYIFRDEGGTPGLTELFEDNGWITCKKESDAVGSRYGGVYVRIDYDSIDDLDGMITLKCEKPYGFGVNNVCILYEVSDWGDTNAISVDINTPFNLKNKLLESDDLGRSNYAERNELYICMINFKSQGHITPYELKFRVEFVHDYQINRANELDEECQEAVIHETFDFVRRHINDIPIGINILPIDKYNIRNNVDSLIKLTKNGEWINCKKESNAVGDKYGGVYIRIDYDSIDELDCMFTPYVRVNSGPDIREQYILYEMTDWGNKLAYGTIPITINERFNLKNKLLDSGLDYANKDHLYICLCSYAPDGISYTFDYDYRIELEPLDTQYVRATRLSDDLMNELRSELEECQEAAIHKSFDFVRRHINDIPIGVNTLPIDNYNIRDNVDSLMKLTENGEWINCKKESEAVGGKYGGVYIRIDYDSIDDLDCMFTLYARVNSGPDIREQHILYEMTDWGNVVGYGVVPITINERFNLKNKLLDSGLDYANKDHLYICLCSYTLDGISYTFDYDFKMEVEPHNTQPVRATRLSEDLMNELRSEFESTDGDYITCWGDSLTAGGGWTDRLQTLSGLTVYNGGTGGENSACIMARQGGDVMMINNITIPAQPQSVTIASRIDGIQTQLGESVTPLLQGGLHVNPCYIGDVKGTLKWTGSGHSDLSGTWTFTRLGLGEEVKITRPTAIRTDFDINRNNPKIMIIFMGQNGGYNNDINELIRQHRLMIEHSNCGDFIVLGLSSGSASARSEYETAMKKEFGRRFISLREYLSTPVYDSDGNIVSCYGLEDAGLTPTPTTYNGVTYDPLDEIAVGTVPHQLLSDSVHYTDACKTVIGDMLYKKLKELNML